MFQAVSQSPNIPLDVLPQILSQVLDKKDLIRMRGVSSLFNKIITEEMFLRIAKKTHSIETKFDFDDAAALYTDCKLGDCYFELGSHRAESIKNDRMVYADSYYGSHTLSVRDLGLGRPVGRSENETEPYATQFFKDFRLNLEKNEEIIQLFYDEKTNRVIAITLLEDVQSQAIPKFSWVHIWDAENGNKLAHFKAVNPKNNQCYLISTVNYVASCKLVITGSCDGKICLWDVNAGKLAQEIPLSPYGVSQTSFNLASNQLSVYFDSPGTVSATVLQFGTTDLEDNPDQQ